MSYHMLCHVYYDGTSYCVSTSHIMSFSDSVVSTCVTGFWSVCFSQQQRSGRRAGDSEEAETPDSRRPLVDIRLQLGVQAAVWGRLHVRWSHSDFPSLPWLSVNTQVCVLVSSGTLCMWSTTVSRCHGWCSATSGRVLTWWTASSHDPLRKPSSPFSWQPPHPSAWSSTWPNLPILLLRLWLGRGINQSVRWLISWLIDQLSTQYCVKSVNPMCLIN